MLTHFHAALVLVCVETSTKIESFDHFQAALVLVCVDTPMKIENVDAESFLAFLEYVYTDHCPIAERDTRRILEVANR